MNDSQDGGVPPTPNPQPGNANTLQVISYIITQYYYALVEKL